VNRYDWKLTKHPESYLWFHELWDLQTGKEVAGCSGAHLDKNAAIKCIGTKATKLEAEHAKQVRLVGETV
jgi:hypothetical protein